MCMSRRKPQTIALAFLLNLKGTLVIFEHHARICSMSSAYTFVNSKNCFAESSIHRFKSSHSVFSCSSSGWSASAASFCGSSLPSRRKPAAIFLAHCGGSPKHSDACVDEIMRAGILQHQETSSRSTHPHYIKYFSSSYDRSPVQLHQPTIVSRCYITAR